MRNMNIVQTFRITKHSLILAIIDGCFFTYYTFSFNPPTLQKRFMKTSSHKITPTSSLHSIQSKALLPYTPP